MIATPKTVEKAIRSLESRMEAVRTHKEEPPRGYTTAEWLRESFRQLDELKKLRFQFPIG